MATESWRVFLGIHNVRFDHCSARLHVHIQLRFARLLRLLRLSLQGRNRDTCFFIQLVLLKGFLHLSDWVWIRISDLVTFSDLHAGRCTHLVLAFLDKFSEAQSIPKRAERTCWVPLGRLRANHIGRGVAHLRQHLHRNAFVLSRLYHGRELLRSDPALNDIERDVLFLPICSVV